MIHAGWHVARTDELKMLGRNDDKSLTRYPGNRREIIPRLINPMGYTRIIVYKHYRLIFRSIKSFDIKLILVATTFLAVRSS